MPLIFPSFFFASILHMLEEYFYPGGFMDLMQRMNPRFAPLVTARMAVVFNGLQLVLCLVAILVWRIAFIFAMSIAGLLFINGLVHLGTCLRIRGYAPGVVTGALLYLPLSAYAYALALRSGQLTPGGVALTLLLGLLYQALPISYLVLAGSW